MFPKKQKKRIRLQYIKSRLFFKKYRLEQALLICSEARGGSTWLMELMSYIPNTITNWEPLHPDLGIVPKHLKLGWRPLLTEADTTPELLGVWRDMLTLKKYNEWTLKFVNVADIAASKIVMTKFVRANGCLPWLVATFPELAYTPILLFRHPITTCISRLKTFEKKKEVALVANLKNFKVPDCKNNERFITYESYLNSLETALEYEVAVWCINNAHLVDHTARNKWITVYYEDLVMDPEAVVLKILEAQQLEIPTEIWNHIPFRKASATNFKDSLKHDPRKQLESFLSLLQTEQLHAIQAVFDHFNFNLYAAFSAYPKPAE